MEWLTILTQLWEQLPEVVKALGTLVLASKVVTVATPTKVDNKIVNGVLRVLNWVSLNILNDKNADDKNAGEK